MNTEPRIAIATAGAFADLVPDDRVLVGARAEAAIWNDATVPWTEFDAVIIRSCWDYHLEHDAFLAWIARLEYSGVRVFNPTALVRWNAEKSYQLDLSSCGVAVVPTRWVERDEVVSVSDTAPAKFGRSTLGDIMREHGWPEVVVKPAISASAHDTWRASASTAVAPENPFRAMVSRGRVLVQPYFEVFATQGEWSLLFYDGHYSHSALKRPRAGDFRVQVEHVIDDQFVLMELELIEPDLYLRGSPTAPMRLATALQARIDEG